jgi:hypothetical protein
MATEVACATVGEGPTSLEGVVEFLIQRAKKEQRGVGRRREDALPPLFKVLGAFDNAPHRVHHWSDSGTKGHDWWALGMAENYCPVNQNADDVSDYCKLGDIVRTRQLNGNTLVAHKSICQIVPTKIVLNVGGNRYIRVPDPTKYNTDLYTPLGVYTYAERGCVVLRCVLEAIEQSNPPKIVEHYHTHTKFYLAFEQSYSNTMMPLCTNKCDANHNGPPYPKPDRYNTFGANDFKTMKLRMDRSDRPAYNALYRILYFIAGEQPRPPPGAFKVNERDGLYQGWLTATDNAGVIRNESMARRIVKAVCKVGVKDLSTDDAPIFGKICACMDMERDAELKKIDGRMRVECHSAECIGGDDDVYKFAPRIPCVPLKICTQSINVEAEKATLENVTIEGCDFGDDPKPPNTSSPKVPLGVRELPPSMRGPDGPATEDPPAEEPGGPATEDPPAEEPGSGSGTTVAIAAAASLLGLIAAVVITVVAVRRRKKSKK